MRRLLPALLLLAAPLALAGPREIDRSRRDEGRAFILHPASALSEADQAELAARGVTIKHALPGGRYLARMSADADVSGDARVLAVEPLTAEKKLHPSAIRAAARGRGMADLNVVFHRDVPFGQAREAILAAGGAMDVFALDYLPSQRIEARVPSSSLQALAADERVLTIAGQRRLRVTANNAITAGLSHVPEVQAAPYGLTGAGVVVSLFELAEAQPSHPEFGGRLTVASTTIGGGTGDRRHATHVAGTIGASGLRPEAKGMAPNVTIHQFCVRNPGGNQCQGNWLTLKQDRLKPLGVIADNNSWGYIWGWQEGGTPIWYGGDIYWGAYDLELAAPIDEISIEKGVLFVHSAGNDGNLPSAFRGDLWKSHRHVDEEDNVIEGQVFCVSQNGSGTDCPSSCNGQPRGCELELHHPQTPYDTHGTTASAKNVISVGAVDQSLALVSFSSRGPAKDGRVKPEVVARGLSVLSTVPTDSYATMNGTSMSSPAVTGIAALLAEQWRRQSGGTDPLPEQLKALIIAGAEDLGNPGPDYSYGFGLVNAKASVDLIRAGRVSNFTFEEGQSQSFEMPLVVDQTQTVRVVLNWADPAIPYLGGDDIIAEEALVNDLDLQVIDPAGNVRLPYVLDRANPGANATTGVNRVDNVEMVEIANATPGVYRAVVRGTRVTEGPQRAVLVSSARLPRPCADAFETGNSPETAFGNIASGAPIAGGFCAAGDVDFYRFTATKTGAAAVTVTTGDTAVRVTLTGNGISRTQDVPAHTTGTLTADVNSVPNTITLRIEPAGSLGAEPQYSFVATYPQTVPSKRRAARS